MLTSLSAYSEYRVFQYYVKSKYPVRDQEQAYLVTTTLDPVSYLAYHGGGNSLLITNLKTWKCQGHTGNGKKYCDSPYDAGKTPASEGEQ